MQLLFIIVKTINIYTVIVLNIFFSTKYKTISDLLLILYKMSSFYFFINLYNGLQTCMTKCCSNSPNVSFVCLIIVKKLQV